MLKHQTWEKSWGWTLRHGKYERFKYRTRE
jgi:hypothetical protein